MKKLALLVLAAIIIASCKTEPVKDYMVLSGKIDNLEKKTIRLKGFKFNKKIKVNSDGTFADTLKIDKGYYSVFAGKKSINLFLNKADDLTLFLDLKDTTGVVSFKGKNATANNYLTAKPKELKKQINTKGLYTLEEVDFLKKVNAIKSFSENLVEKSNLSEEFKKIELKNINYNYIIYLDQFPLYHGYLIKNKDFKTSDSFPKLSEKLDLNNEEDYNNFSVYRKIIELKLKKLADDKSKKDNGDYPLTYMNIIKEKITTKNILDDLLFKNARFGITYTEELPEFYKKFMDYSSNEKHKKEITKTYNKLIVTVKGQPSPKFVNYENYKGGTTSLDDLKGKYVYIDVWATWCGPCKAEIPALQQLEKDYHGKNIEFVSISIDNERTAGTWVKAEEKWRKMVADKNLTGTQLYAGKDNSFTMAYQINAIPRFLLIDPNGNIIDANAPRPSDKKIRDIFSELGI